MIHRFFFNFDYLVLTHMDFPFSETSYLFFFFFNNMSHTQEIYIDRTTVKESLSTINIRAQVPMSCGVFFLGSILEINQLN